MELQDNNLYANGYIVNFEEEREQMLLRSLLPIEAKNEDRYHTVRYDDSLSRLAGKYYSGAVEDASKYWYVIADANNVLDPMDLSEWVGKDILIPDILRVRLMIFDDGSSSSKAIY